MKLLLISKAFDLLAKLGSSRRDKTVAEQSEQNANATSIVLESINNPEQRPQCYPCVICGAFVAGFFLGSGVPLWTGVV